VEHGGFVQPADLPGELAGAGCFVLASRFEPWGVVLHEAASAGVPLICTDACGAAELALEDGRNGALVPAGDARGLARAMARIASLPEEGWRGMSRHGHGLSRRLTPPLWANGLLARASEALERTGRRGR
jgi:glycosyltransferase involved in cell wall biosynthesis